MNKEYYEPRTLAQVWNLKRRGSTYLKTMVLGVSCQSAGVYVGQSTGFGGLHANLQDTFVGQHVAVLCLAPPDEGEFGRYDGGRFGAMDGGRPERARVPWGKETWP